MKQALGSLLRKLGLRNGAKVDNREAVHFLHIGKCAGTQVKLLAEQINAQSQSLRVIKHHHDIYMDAIPADARYFFATRDPISRFRSGFYSRKRRGRPVFDYAWTSGEALAYERFEHANDLAEALFTEGESGRMAFMAMKSIRHTAQDQVDWFAQYGDIFVSRPPIWILRQEHFAADFSVLATRLGVDAKAIMPEQEQGGELTHANDYRDAPELSPLARENLARWYAQDLQFYAMCEWWIAKQLAFGAQD